MSNNFCFTNEWSSAYQSGSRSQHIFGDNVKKVVPYKENFEDKMMKSTIFFNSKVIFVYIFCVYLYILIHIHINIFKIYTFKIYLYVYVFNILKCAYNVFLISFVISVLKLKEYMGDFNK